MTKKIIVRMPNWLGDAVMATPVLADVRNHWAEAHITVMCQANVGSLLRNDPHIDELCLFDGRRQKEIIKTLRKGHYDLGILLTNSFSSAWWFFRGKVEYRVGYAGQWRRRLLSKAVPHLPQENQEHQVIFYKKLLTALGIPLSDQTPRLYLTEENIKNGEQILQKYGVSKDSILIGVNPGAAYGSAKCWLPDRFRETAQRLLKNPSVQVICFGDSKSAPLIKNICAGISERALNLAGKTSVEELMALIKLCRVMLTNDSGPMHIAAALATPLVALFGPTNAKRTRPYNHGVVIQKPVECSPCYKRECSGDLRCMRAIDVDSVEQALQSFI